MDGGRIHLSFFDSGFLDHLGPLGDIVLDAIA
jgi:hypothetical protein